MTERRFSHAIAEGDGISVIAAVEDPAAARAAEEQLAEALVVHGDPAGVREASSLPILWRAEVSLEQASAAADACLLLFDERLEELHAQAIELGLDCAVEVRDEDELEQALERVDPEIFLLSPAEREDDERPLDVVLGLLAAVPAGKLAIADLQLTNREEVRELERAGCDAVIVHGHEVSPLVGVLLQGGAAAAPKTGCPADWARGWQKLADKINAPVYCPTWMPNPLDAQIGGQYQDIYEISKDRSYLVSFLEHGDLGSGDVHVNFRGYPGRLTIPKCPAPVGKSTIPCFADPAGHVNENGIHATVYQVNQGADQWHILLAWHYHGSLYAVSQHVIIPYDSATRVRKNLAHLLKSLVLVEPAQG